MPLPRPDGGVDAVGDALDEDPDLGDVFDRLEELAATVDSAAEREHVEETMRLTAEASQSDAAFGQVIWGFDRGDAAEAFLGSFLFGIPMAVEGGTQEVGAFLADRPLLLAGTAAFAVTLVVGVLYVADIQDVRVRNRILGLFPRRLVGVLGISLLLAAAMLTAWGRITWATPVPALSNVVVAFTPMAVGAALGDILPGS
ncbi:MAG: DUF2391 family protein [Haloferacaceae archaeon]